MKPKVLDGLVLVYGILLIVMGIAGYVIAHHAASLVAGAGSGVIVLGFLAITAKKRQLGRIGVAVVSLLILLMFAANVVKDVTGKPTVAPWRDYTLFIASVVVFGALGFGHMSAMKARRLE